MNSIFIAIILGLVQGLCEFLPVSSSGHLMIFQYAFGITEGNAFFSVMLHFGTLIAVFIAYRKTIWELLKKPFQRKTLLLVLSTIVTALMYVFGEKLFDTALNTPVVLGYSFIFTAVLLVISDMTGKIVKNNPKQSGDINSLSIPGALGIGFIQGIAILPGVSRSGSTITGAKIFGLSGDNAAEFSFLLSIPAILGGFVTEIPDALRSNALDIPWLSIIIGTVVAGISGFFAIKFMIKLITKCKLSWFAIYVAVIGILVLLDVNALHIVF